LFLNPLCDASWCELAVFGVGAVLAEEKRKGTRCCWLAFKWTFWT
jgi:hypothetical protein